MTFAAGADGTTSIDDTPPRRNGRVRTILGIIAVVVVIALVAIAAFIFRPWENNNGATPQVTESALPTPAPTDPATEAEANDTVTVNEGDLTWAYPQDLRDIVEEFGTEFKKVDGEFIPDLSTCSNDDLVKLSSDAICGPLPEKTDEAVIAWILTHPDFGAMIGTGLCKEDLVFDTAVGDISLFENNPWCVDFNFTSDAQINNWAVRVMKSEGAERAQYAKQLVLVAKLWIKLTVFKVGDDTADSSYRLVLDVVGSGMAVNPLNPFKIVPEFELAAVPYTGQFILATIVIKGQPIGCNYVGINVGFGGMVNKDGDGGDGRLAFFKCEVPPTEVGCTGDCGGTTVICEYGYNPDGECLPAKTGGLSQTAPIDKSVAGNDGLKAEQEVKTGEPDYDVSLVDQGGVSLIEVTG